MKKVGIITINDDDNYGNRLQNYATQEILKKMKFDCITIKNTPILNTKKNFVFRLLKFFKKSIIKNKNAKNMRKKEFSKFNQNIRYNNRYITPYSKSINKQFDYFITGSDQVWNPNNARLREVDLLEFAIPSKRIAFSASFGISQLPDNKKEITANALKQFKAISVREDAGKEIIEKIIDRNDVEVLIDPTMMLVAEEWNNVAKKPNQLKNDRYILNYFLGELQEEWNQEINKIANKYNCEVINILDKNSLFYETGPSEFLYLERNAFLVCTDSFHSSVFSIIYDTPFIVFERKQKDVVSMNSRIDTLLSKFNLQSRKFNGVITNEQLKCDYTKVKEILEKEKEKSIIFLKKALDI